MNEIRTDDLVIKQGSTWEAHWPMQGTDGSPADLEGWSARAQVRANRRATSDLLYTFDASISASDVVLRVDAADSSAWTWRGGVYDLEIYRDDEVFRITQGNVAVDVEVTRGDE